MSRASSTGGDDGDARVKRDQSSNRIAHSCVTSSLHVSPRGEAKCVRGPSGRGASRAEEKGACNFAFKVFHESRVTKHESRPFYRVLRPSGGEKCRLTHTRSGRLQVRGCAARSGPDFTDAPAPLQQEPCRDSVPLRRSQGQAEQLGKTTRSRHPGRLVIR